MNAPHSAFFETSTPGVDCEEVSERLRKRAGERAEQGFDPTFLEETISRFDLKSVHNEEDFLKFFLERLQELHQVDINDFPIHSHRGPAGRPITWVKGGIWNLLKFYTYRLFSQQNQINAQLVAALAALLRKSEQRIERLEERIAELEAAAGEPSTGPEPGPEE